MMERLRRCSECLTYTFQETCPKGHGPTISPLPPKLSFPDKYGHYRLEEKKKFLKERDLI